MSNVSSGMEVVRLKLPSDLVAVAIGKLFEKRIIHAVPRTTMNGAEPNLTIVTIRGTHPASQVMDTVAAAIGSDNFVRIP